MKIKHALILSLFFFASLSLFSQETKKAPATKSSTSKSTGTKTPAAKSTAPKPEPAMTADQQQQAMMSYMAPGKMQQMLEAANGQWREMVTFWMTPGGPPSKSESNCSNQMILGGRYQESLHQGEMMGMPFEGKGIIGYDNAKKVFQSMWIDNMGTGIMFLEGKYDEATKTITFKGNEVDPMSGKSNPVREIVKFIDDKTQMIEMYMMKDGKEYKAMEINSKRVS